MVLTDSVDKFPFVSIVIPTWNRAVLLADCVAALKMQDYPRDRFEIIIVDDGSNDATPDLGRRLEDGSLPKVVYLRQERKGPNAARNKGISAACGDPICLVDDDVDTPRRWLKELVTGAYRHPEAGAVGGPIRLRLEGTTPRFCGREPLVGEAEFDLGSEERPVREVVSANMAVRVWALREVGLFDETLPIYGDELEWERRLTRAGRAILYIPAASLWHRRTAPDLKLSKLLRKYLRRGTHYVVFARRVGELESLSVWVVLRKLVSSLAHAVRRRCTMGVLMVAQEIGVLWGMFRNMR
jgi:GT2 family glycosyltransferase